MSANTRMFICVVIFACTVVSCVNTRKSVYFNQERDANFPDSIMTSPTIIQKNDILSITVSSVDPNVAAAFNTPNVTYSNANSYTGSAVTVSGYLVNAQGLIDFPVIGSISAEGLTELQLRDKIARILVDRKLLVYPIITIRHLNFKVTVLGEVMHPLVINVPNEKITLLEALGLAGDITIYGRRDQVLLIRQENGQKMLRHLDLNTTMLLTSPYYYLKANDVVYVEPNKNRVAGSSRSTILLPALLSGLSFIAIIIDRATRN